jgi:DNA repair exonuclease SbcCD ATPase subunit
VEEKTVNLDQLIRMADRLSQDLQTYQTAVSREKREVRRAKRKLELLIQAQEILQNIAQLVQQKAHSRIADLVTRCLRAVFGGEYEFKIHFERKRGKTEARPVYVKGGIEINPLDDSGGVADVTSFALRLAALTLQRPPRRRILVLDEPMKFVSEKREYRERVRQLMEILAEEMKVQIILVTHDKALEIGRVIEL